MDERLAFLDRLVPSEHLAPLPSAVVAFGLMPGVFVLASLVAVILWPRARILARRVPLAQGDMVVSGVVETDAGDEPAARRHDAVRTAWC